MTARNRSLVVVGVIGILGVVSVGWILSARARTPATQNRSALQSTKTMQSMPGMPGMAMADSGNIALTPAQIQQLGVTFGTVDVRPLVSEIRANGTFTVDERRVTQIAPKFGGFVERLEVNTTGQMVRKGDPLFDVYSPDLVAAQQELLLAARLQRDVGGTDVPGVPATKTDLLSAAKRRLALWEISDAQIDEVLRTGRPRRSLTLFSPSTGIVTEKKIVEGQSITAGEQLYTIADLSDVWLEVQLREADAGAATIGASADIDVTGQRGRSLTGRVSYLYPTLDSATRTLRARIVVDNADGMLKPGMYATVRLRTTSPAALTVPASAVLRTGTRNLVFMDMGKGQLMPMEIEVGRTAGDFTEVLSGLERGQRVVTSAQFLLDSESNLAEVMRSMIGQMGR